ncbi:MAG: LamG domain-containing protein, partial [Nanoarchaeota archaeon]
DVDNRFTGNLSSGGSSSLVVNTTGVIKQAFFFNATNGGYINYGNNSAFAFSNTNLTIMAWIKTSSSQSAGVVNRYNDDGSPNQFGWNLNAPATSGGNRDSGVVEIDFRNGTSEIKSVTTKTIDDNQWHHLTGVYYGAGRNPEVFIDGVNVSVSVSGTPFTGLPAVNSNFTIGHKMTVGFGTDMFRGSIDEVKLYNRSLSFAEIANEYQMMSYGSTEKDASGTPAPDIPIAAWHFDDNISGVRADDFFGDHNATLLNGSTFGPGIFGTNGIVLDGINDYAATSDSQALNLSRYTIIMWVLRSGHGSGLTPGMIAKGGTDNRPYSIGLNNETQQGCSSCGFSVWFGDLEADGGGDFFCNATVLDQNVLTHIAYTFNGTHQRTYTNGTLIKTCNPGLVVLASDTNPIVIGKVAANDQSFFNGTIDEVEIYDRVLSPEEINQSFRRSFPVFGLNYSRYGPNDSLTFQIEPIQFDGAVGSAVNSTSVGISGFFLPGVQRVNITPRPVNFTQDAAGVWNYTDVDADIENGTLYQWFINGTEAWRDSSLVGYWKLDNNFLDQLGISNGTSPTDTATPRNTTGLIKGAMTFNGTTQYINFSNASRLSMRNNLSVSVWVNQRAFGASQRYISNNDASAFKTNQVYGLGYGVIQDSYFFEISTNPTTAVDIFASAQNRFLNTWHHIAGTYDGANISIYLDGALSASAAQTGTLNSATGNSLFAGTFETSSTFYNGALDEIKIWNRSLSADEIENEFNMMFYGQTQTDDTNGTAAQDIPVALWHFDDDAVSTSAFDYFGDSQARISNATRTQGVFGTSAFSFNKINASLIVNHSQLFNLTGNITWMMWASTNSTGSVRGIIGKGFNSASNPSFLTYLTSSNGIICEIYNSTGTQISATAIAAMPTDGTFHHIACVHNSTNLSVYLDGVFKASAQSGGAIRVGDNQLLIGNAQSAALYNGTIDEVEIYNRPFTADEINQSFNRNFPHFGLSRSTYSRESTLTFEITPGQNSNGIIFGQALNSTTITVQPTSTLLGNLSCQFRTFNCLSGETDLLRISNLTNGHVEQPNATTNNFAHVLCCRDVSGVNDITNVSGSSAFNFIDLYNVTNSHVEHPDLTTASIDMFIGGSSEKIECTYPLLSGLCGQNQTCLATFSFNGTNSATNMHVSNCSQPAVNPFNTSVCCSFVTGNRYFSPVNDTSNRSFVANATSSGVISDFDRTSVAQLITYTNVSLGKRLQMLGLFNESDVNASLLTIDTNATHVAVNLTQVTGIRRQHNLIINNSNLGVGVFVCKNATRLSQLNNCADRVRFKLTEINNVARDNITVIIQGTDYIIYNVSGTGAGPEALNSNLTIFDDTDVQRGSLSRFPTQNVIFFANYTNITNNNNISGSNIFCEIRLVDTSPVNMSFNTSSGLYEFNRTFTSPVNATWNATCDASVINLSVRFVNDTVVISPDTTAPRVVNLTPINATNLSVNSLVRVAANVTDLLGVNVVRANVTKPNAAIVQLTLLNSSAVSDIWNATFTGTDLEGGYTVRFIANDTQAQSNITVITQFNVSSNALVNCTSDLFTSLINTTCFNTVNLNVSEVGSNSTNSSLNGSSVNFSTIFNTAIHRSTILFSNKTNSLVINSTNSNTSVNASTETTCTLTGSALLSTTCINSSLILASITGSTANHTIINATTTSICNVQFGRLESGSCTNSTKSNVIAVSSTDNSSVVRNSNETNCVVFSSTLTGVLCNNATIQSTTATDTINNNTIVNSSTQTACKVQFGSLDSSTCTNTTA